VYVKKIMYIKINNEGAKKTLVSISIMVIIIASTSAVVVSLVPFSSVEGSRGSNNPPGFKSIKKFDSNGKFITSWGTEGTGDGQFLHAHGIAIDSSGNVYVVDSQNERIQKFDSNGNFITKWGTEGYADGARNTISIMYESNNAATFTRDSGI
jgi:DNA-binding beta-propeller fold protein YncE